MGYGYLRRGDYENAYGVRPKNTCQDYMARIRKKQRDPDLDVRRGIARTLTVPFSTPLFKRLRAATCSLIRFTILILRTSGVIDFRTSESICQKSKIRKLTKLRQFKLHLLFALLPLRPQSALNHSALEE